MLNTLIKLYVVFCLSFYGFIIISEIISRKLPNTGYSKWWRKYFMDECEKCD